MDVLEIKNITYRYTNSSEKILSSINQKFQLGKFYAIIGKSGAGKSTLLSLLAGLDKPQTGKVLFQNKNIEEKGYSNHRKNNISLVFQNYNLIDYLSPIENIRLVNKKASEGILIELGLDDNQIKRNVSKSFGVGSTYNLGRRTYRQSGSCYCWRNNRNVKEVSERKK